MMEAEHIQHERAPLPAAKASTRRLNAVPPQLCLQVRFFGRFEILHNGTLAPVRGNAKALAILRYLLAHPKRPISKDYLMGWLWPESDSKRARSSLTSAIHALRGLLVALFASENLADYILFESGYYRLSPNVRVSSDVAEFDARHEHGRNLEKALRMAEAAEEYQKAVALYQGDYLVEDLYEEWPMIERERLGDVYMEMLNRLAIYHAEIGEYRDCIRTCYRLLEREPSCEDSNRLVMECYARLGLRAQALRHYQLFKGILQRKLGLDPSPEIEALYRRILSPHRAVVNGGVL
jgi:DNA-binding SARP family transcriptional activator